MPVLGLCTLNIKEMKQDSYVGEVEVLFTILVQPRLSREGGGDRIRTCAFHSLQLHQKVAHADVETNSECAVHCRAGGSNREGGRRWEGGHCTSTTMQGGKGRAGAMRIFWSALGSRCFTAAIIFCNLASACSYSCFSFANAPSCVKNLIAHSCIDVILRNFP